MAIIKTFVFMDLETTGLPEYECNKTRIIELSMVAAQKSHLLDTTPGEVPRVLQKLNLCIYPNKLISHTSSKITGLDNDLLEAQSPFDFNTFNLIKLFLNQLPKPVCLVAHNGYTFDYPILQTEFKRLSKALPDDLLCVDSLIAFRELNNQNIYSQHVDFGISLSNQTSNESKFENIKHAVNGEETIKTDDVHSSSNIQSANETTPKRPTNNSLDNRNRQNAHNKDDRLKQPGEGHVSRRRLNFTSMLPKKSYKLVDIFRRSYGKDPVNVHHAEADVYVY